MKVIPVVAVLVLLLPACAGQQKASEPQGDQPAVKSETRPDCMRQTGTRIARKEGECVDQPGRVIDREEIERSGATSTGEAIKRTIPR